MTKKITLTELKAKIRDIDTPDAEIAAYLELAPEQSDAFAPQVRINPELVDDEGLEAEIAMRFFNAMSKRRRQKKYLRKIKDGWSGLRIVSEGDSWFQYPFLLEDVIDQLSEDYAIYSLGAAGDLVQDMLDQDEILQAVRDHNPHLVLISGGGNDLLGDGMLQTALHAFKTGRPSKDYPNAAFDKRIKAIISIYRSIFTALLTEFPTLKILCHGYDYAEPANARWLGKPMAALGISDFTLQVQIVAEMIDRFNTALVGLANEFPGAVVRVNCLNSVRGNWHDELHPNNIGYAQAADQFRAVIGSMFGSTTPQEVSPQLSPGKEAMIEATDLEPEAFRELVDHRGRELLDIPLPPTDDESRRKEIEQDISQHFEKISGGADFLPASFLYRGADAAASVCRINLPGGSGTGFLIATRSFIMTNNHVIASKDEAREAIAEFRFEEGGESLMVNLDPDRFFITSKELDFTIVGCNEPGLDYFEPIPLLRNPSTVTRGEQVNIVQHPRGRPKEVALHNNKVLRVKDRVVWYETDTEPGSSGSPVFNNTWDLVALHHAGWIEGGVTTNEGVRIAAIVSHLVARQHVESSASNTLLELLSTIPDSSPHLGFFDIAGITGARTQEVEVPEYKGSLEFADIGFWNIEHFNDAISDMRVDKVASVLGHLSLDAVGLVEVQRDAMDRLIAGLQALGHSYDYKYLDVKGRQDLAVLYDSKTTEVNISAKILNRHKSAWAATTATGRTAFPRRPLIAHVKVAPNTKDGIPVEFIMVLLHLKAFGDPESKARRRLAAEILTEVIADIRETEKLPVVLGGDLNETLNTDVLRPLTDAPDLFTLTTDDAANNALSYVGARYRSLIDHIVVSNDVVMSPISGDDAAIVRLDKSVTDFTQDVSDHVPLVIRMVNRDAPLQIDGGCKG
ncbi:trypsin-like peptidase domain-containing protein [Pseudorhodobacter aquimaris]|uniref:trypsin-like peptidase domain-containing protein n=1 Tax=Pseudorhodobacter aquimaris TaxID=687412 RepID=UPI00067C4AD2|nr:trypsin-like peptidase domain-containing protein [Pseudorhodobacter aquimaris]